MITIVRVSRKYKQEVVEGVQIEVVHDEDVPGYDLKRRSIDLVEAMEACGQVVGWQGVSTKQIESYGADVYEAEILVTDGNAVASEDIIPPAPPPSI